MYIINGTIEQPINIIASMYNAEYPLFKTLS